MNPNLDPENDEPLLDRILGDEEWRTASAAFKASALGAFRARQRQRRTMRWTATAVVMTAVIAGSLRWSGILRPTPVQIAVTPAEPAKPAETARFLTDQQLLDMFPKGSCFIAEVDGKKELVFLDPKDEQRYMARPAAPGN